MLPMFTNHPYAAECAEGKDLYQASRTNAALHFASLSPIGLSAEHQAYTRHLYKCPLCRHRNDHKETPPHLDHKLSA
jgi:hypothetical protein